MKSALIWLSSGPFLDGRLKLPMKSAGGKTVIM